METCEIKGWYLTLVALQKKHDHHPPPKKKKTWTPTKPVTTAAFFQKETSAPGGWVQHGSLCRLKKYMLIDMVAFAG